MTDKSERVTESVVEDMARAMFKYRNGSLDGWSPGDAYYRGMAEFALRALPVTDEREGRHKVGNPVCPKCFASHPPLLDCTLQFVANAAPVEGDEAWETAGSLRYIKETPTPEQRDNARGSALYQQGDMWLVWVNEGDLHDLMFKAIVAKAPDAGPVEREARWAKRPQGDAGDAIDFAADHCAPDEAVAFLEDWRSDRASEWPGYMKWLAVQRDGARAAALARYQQQEG